MGTPRFRISWLMILVVFVAIDFAAARAMLDVPTLTSELLGLGGLPMANVLIVGLFLARRHPRSRFFFRGFQLVGASALFLFFLGAVGFPEMLVNGYAWVAGPILKPLEPWVDRWPRLGLATVVCIFSLGLVGPQLALALFGGLFHHRYRIVRREGPVAVEIATGPAEASAARPA